MGDALIQATLGVDPDKLEDRDWVQAIFKAESVEKYRAKLIAAQMIK